jgi:hypothetical protein
MRVGYDERAATIDQRHAVGPAQAVGDLAGAAVRPDTHDAARSSVYVGVAVGVNDELVERGVPKPVRSATMSSAPSGS